MNCFPVGGSGAAGTYHVDSRRFRSPPAAPDSARRPREGERMLHRIVGKPTRFRALGQLVEHQNIGDAGPGSGAIEVGGARDECREVARL